jgi:hypothetical protein
MNWEHKDEWHSHGKDFLIVVKHHTVVVHESNYYEGPHRWCVYAYIYPKHPHFAKFDGPDMWQDAAAEMPLHGGPSLLRWHRGDDGKPTSVQVGADYNHLHDDYFTQYSTADDAREVFIDAERLHAWLSDDQQAKEQP